MSRDQDVVAPSLFLRNAQGMGGHGVFTYRVHALVFVFLIWLAFAPCEVGAFERQRFEWVYVTSSQGCTVFYLEVKTDLDLAEAG